MLNDLRYALRTFTRTPGFTVVAVLTLALGIGAATAMFSVVQAAVLRPVPYPDPERLYLIAERLEEGQRARLTALDFVDLQRSVQKFESIAAHAGNGFTFTGEGDPEMVLGQIATASLFDVLGTRPMLGRAFLPEEQQAGQSDVVVLSHGLWQRRFAGDTSAIGRAVTMNGRRFTVIGVMPRGFEHPHGRYVLWTPLTLSGRAADGPPINRGAHYIQAVAKLKPGVAPEEAQQELDAFAAQLSAAHPHDRFTLKLEAMTESVAAPARPALLLLLAGVGCLLLIACANVTGLLLARATSRSGELAVRAALGASRWRLARQLLTETAVLYLAGGGFGVLLASWGLEAARRFGPDDVPRLQAATIDGQVLLVAALMTAVPALLFGAAPSFRFATRSVRSAADTRTTTAGVAAGRARSGLVIAQIALSLVLLVAAGLVARSFLRLQGTDSGFDAEGVVTFSLVMPVARYPAAPQMMSMASRIEEDLAARPGVIAVGTTTALPLSGQNIENGFQVDGYQSGSGREPVAGIRGVNADYFRALGIGLRGGRMFSRGDNARSEPVVIINERFAKEYFAGRDPVDGRVLMRGETGWRRVVGIVADVRHDSPAEEAKPEAFFPYEQVDPDFLATWGRGLYVALRTSGEPDAVMGAARASLRGLDPAMPVNDLQPMRALMADAVSQPRFRFMLFAAFAAIAAVLAAVGLFGVMAFFVAQRAREIGIRVALGAGGREVAGLIGWRAARLAAAGIALGLAGSVAAGRALEAILFGISPLDPLTFVSAAALLLAAAAAATWVPARRALRVDPIAALRAD